MNFEFIENITRADVAIRAYGEKLDDLFVSAGHGLVATMIENYKNISRKIIREVHIENIDLEMLFYNFLDEFLFFKDSENLFLLPDQVDVFLENEKYILHASLSGEKIDPNKHSINVDVKAVTMHHLSVKKEKDSWVAIFVLDV